MRALDLFAGCGGLSLGLTMAGIEVVAAIERDPDACASYRANLGDHMIQASIEDVDADDLPDCDLIAGGPPCQGFSYAGKRDKDDPRNRLWREFFRIVEAKQPAFILIENVRGMLTAGEDKPLILAFRAIGYHVSPYLLNAADYGVPQRRLRVFYVGNRIGAANPCPTPTHAQPPRHIMLGLQPWVTVRQALGIGANCVGNVPTHAGRHGSLNRPEREPGSFILDLPSRALRSGVHGQPGYSPRHVAGYVPVLPCIDLDVPAPTIQGGGTETGGAEPVRHRLRGRGAGDGDGTTLDDPAPVISASWSTDVVDPAIGHHRFTDSDGRVHTRPSNEAILRRLTVHECATLQDFPPSFVFHGSKTSQYRQVGNAVAVGMARALGQALSVSDRSNASSAVRCNATDTAP